MIGPKSDNARRLGRVGKVSCVVCRVSCVVCRVSEVGCRVSCVVTAHSSQSRAQIMDMPA